MADVDDTELDLETMGTPENAWTGRMLKRLVRHVRVLSRDGRRLEDRVEAIEQQLGITPPPPP